MLQTAIERAKTQRTKYTVLQKEGYDYQLYTAEHHGRILRLTLDFYRLDKLPDCHDNLYFSENLIGGMREGLYSFQYSAEIGWPCVREPHDFLLDPKEFLILEYADGNTIILEEVYG